MLNKYFFAVKIYFSQLNFSQSPIPPIKIKTRQYLKKKLSGFKVLVISEFRLIFVRLFFKASTIFSPIRLLKIIISVKKFWYSSINKKKSILILIYGYKWKLNFNAVCFGKKKTLNFFLETRSSSPSKFCKM